MNAVATKEAFDGKNITPFDEAVDTIQSLYDEAKNWADGSAIENQEQCDALDVLDKALMDAGKRLDGIRVSEKKPLDDQIDAIQARFNPFIQPKRGKVDMARAALNPIRAGWRQKVADERAAIAEKARLEFEEEQRKAREAMQASAGDLEAREAAERKLEDAKIAEADMKRTAKAATTGLRLRTTYHAELTDLGAAIKHYWPTHKQAFADLVLDIANRQAGAGIEIPGFRVIEEKRAI